MAEEHVQNEFGIDTTVLGEAENVVGALFDEAAKGKSLPRVVAGTPVEISNILNIVGPTIQGLVEVARGCGRGCDFSNPALLQLKCRSLTDILEDVQVNGQSGMDTITLHAEDIFRYRVNGIQPDQIAVEGLFKSVCNVEGIQRVYVSHGAFASVFSAPRLLPNLTEIMNLDKSD